ncbi:type IV pilin [Methanoculleus sp. UBA312]|jgi:FlaG/FlaF family flagellin (archaellin)|uniref:type IV pilin n=3 Tax=Methanoculleus TaxID=45989 RepID=UPI0031BB51FA
MHLLKDVTRMSRRIIARSGMDREDAVSPVVGVMLMLVVTIIIAAVVSAFSGSLIDGTDQKAPTLTMDIKIANTGSWSGSGFTATVTSVSAPIHTKDLKIVTSWKPNGGTAGGSTSQPLGNNVNSSIRVSEDPQSIDSNAPYGYGPGVNGTTDAQSLNNPFTHPDQQFGNYTLMQGTGLVALPYGSSYAMIPASQEQVGEDDGGYGVKEDAPYKYIYGAVFTSDALDAAQAVLGKGWENLRVGDTVNVKVVHIPTGKVILDKNVAVTEG